MDWTAEANRLCGMLDSLPMGDDRRRAITSGAQNADDTIPVVGAGWADWDKCFVQSAYSMADDLGTSLEA